MLELSRQICGTPSTPPLTRAILYLAGPLYQVADYWISTIDKNILLLGPKVFSHFGKPLHSEVTNLTLSSSYLMFISLRLICQPHSVKVMSTSVIKKTAHYQRVKLAVKHALPPLKMKLQWTTIIQTVRTLSPSHASLSPCNLISLLRGREK
jgi:hypothetical protein